MVSKFELDLYCTMLLLNYYSVFFLYFIDAFLHQLIIGNQKCDDDDDDNYDGGMIACLAHDIKIFEISL